jgi:hypothetical protein
MNTDLISTRAALHYHKHQRQKFQEFLLGTKKRPRDWTNEEIEQRIQYQSDVVNRIKTIRREKFPQYRMTEDEYDAEIQNRLGECLL